MTTPKIVMPELAVGQAGKEITHNDALAILDQLVQARVVDKDLATPPGSPANGAAYIVASSPTGAWVGHTNHIAYWLTAVGAWQFLIPAAGWEVWVTDESLNYTFSGSAWAISSSQFTGGTMTSAINEAPIVTLASAATVNIGAAAANTVSISGTTTITAFDTIASGALRRLHFQAALTLTHNGTSLILPTAANITTAAGDVAEFVSLGAGNWRCTGYERAAGNPINYQEGLWTPVLTFATPGNLSVAYSVQVGAFTKNGREITARFNVQTSSFTHTTASGALQLTGLPFTASSVTGSRGPLDFAGINKASYTQAVTVVGASQTMVTFNASGMGQPNSVIMAADCPTGGFMFLVGSILYMV